MNHLLLFSVAIAVVTILLVAWQSKSNTATTISLNAASHPVAFYLTAIGLTCSIVFACLYYTGWLLPEYDLPLVSTGAFLSIAVSFVITSWVPDVVGSKRKVHRGAAYMAVLLMPLLLLSILTIQIPIHIFIVTFIMLILECAMIYLLFFVSKARRWFLPLQVLYLSSFFIPLFLLTYGV